MQSLIELKDKVIKYWWFLEMLQTNASHVSVYKRTLWSPALIEGLDTHFSINYKEKVKELEKQVTLMIINSYENGDMSTLKEELELIDNLGRLGLGYRFQTNITRMLNKIAALNENSWGVEEEEEEEEENILAVASLKFRLLRQHGYRAQDFCKRLKDSGGVLTGVLQTNTKALLSIYDASYLALEGEIDLNEARLFVTENLLKLNNGHHENEAMNERVKRALDNPLYRMMPRLQARHYIDEYGKREDANQLLLELATLDFNMVQSAHRIDLQELSKWWQKNIGLTSKLSFTRDRLVECFFASVGIVFEPQYSACRIGVTKICSLVTTIDDIYDVYGSSLDELKMFTNAVKRWEISRLECMPENLQIGFLALYNTVNEMSYETLITQGKNIIPILSKVWGEVAEAFLVEATWSHGNCIPSLEDYLDNAWISASGVVILTHGYFLMNQDFKKDAIESLEKCHDLYKWSSMLLRLYNDLAISSDEIDKGGDASAILCYMRQHGVCEEVAREYINSLVDQAWRKMIEARIACSEDHHLEDPLTDIAINLARVSNCIYEYGDGIKAPDEARAKDRLLSIIIDPITIN